MFRVHLFYVGTRYGYSIRICFVRVRVSQAAHTTSRYIFTLTKLLSALETCEKRYCSRKESCDAQFEPPLANRQSDLGWPLEFPRPFQQQCTYVRMPERTTNKDVRTVLVVSKWISSLWKSKDDRFNPESERTYQLVFGSIPRRESHIVFLGSIWVNPPCSSHVDASKHDRKCYQP